MAPLSRRTWANLETEVKLRLGNPNNTTINVQYFLWAAYLRIALTYHHFELDTVSSPLLTLSTSVNSVALPADTFVVVHAELLNTGGTSVVGQLEPKDYAALVRGYSATPAQPKLRARFASTLYFNCLPDQAYKCRVSYYRNPTAPDFSSGSPETHVECDEHLIEMATALASGATANPAVGLNRQLLADWLAEQVRSPLLDSVEDKRERPTTNRTLGGAQG